MITSLKLFIERLIDEKGLSALEPEVLKQIKADLSDRLEDRVNAVILEHLPPDNLSAFEKLLDTKASDEVVQKFCHEQIPNLDEAIAGALIEFQQTYLRV